MYLAASSEDVTSTMIDITITPFPEQLHEFADVLHSE
uniref:Uncharacterized protein n=1 Tax=Anguilla anguilla TaxID=7936 RepID=A0A0E9STZ6_ANGAN